MPRSKPTRSSPRKTSRRWSRRNSRPRRTRCRRMPRRRKTRYCPPPPTGWRRACRGTCPACPTARSCTPACRPRRRRSARVNHVVYPTHGVGKVERIATEEIAGHKLELIHITFEENRMTLRVPVAKARSAGLRKLATRKMFDDAMAVLKGRARIKRTMWVAPGAGIRGEDQQRRPDRDRGGRARPATATPASRTKASANGRSTKPPWTALRRTGRAGPNGQAHRRHQARRLPEDGLMRPLPPGEGGGEGPTRKAVHGALTQPSPRGRGLLGQPGWAKAPPAPRPSAGSFGSAPTFVSVGLPFLNRMSVGMPRTA